MSTDAPWDLAETSEQVQLDDDGVALVSPAADPVALLLLGHGAGGRVDGLDLQALAQQLPGLGISVVRHIQPWKARGARVAPRSAVLDQGWATALRWTQTRYPQLPLVTGGHSAGARCACRGSAATELAPQRAVVALSFPLHPPGQPEKSRLPELLGVQQPVLVVQGERDPFGTAPELHDSVPEGWFEPPRRLVEVPSAAHDLVPARRALTVEQAQHLVVAAVASFLGRV
ncbi:MAG: hydrolase [Actinomycetia bacterium]|nr:hydrolase [Actinomycetes bacterium]